MITLSLSNENGDMDVQDAGAPMLIEIPKKVPSPPIKGKSPPI